MKTLELRALLCNKRKEVIISEEMIEIFNFWKSRREEEPKPLEIFYAGYILSNPMVRQEYQKQMRMNKDKI